MRVLRRRRPAPLRGEPFARFTDRARDALVLAQEEARNMTHNYLGTEHLLIGVARVSGGVGASVLSQFGVQAEAIRGDVLRLVGKGSRTGGGLDPDALSARH